MPYSQPEPKFRYVCHGCTNDVCKMEDAKAGVSVTCPTCGMQQVTKSENFIAL